MLQNPHIRKVWLNADRAGGCFARDEARRSHLPYCGSVFRRQVTKAPETLINGGMEVSKDSVKLLANSSGRTSECHSDFKQIAI